MRESLTTRPARLALGAIAILGAAFTATAAATPAAEQQQAAVHRRPRRSRARP